MTLKSQFKKKENNVINIKLGRVSRRKGVRRRVLGRKHTSKNFLHYAILHSRIFSSFTHVVSIVLVKKSFLIYLNG